MWVAPVLIGLFVFVSTSIVLFLVEDWLSARLGSSPLPGARALGEGGGVGDLAVTELCAPPVGGPVDSLRDLREPVRRPRLYSWGQDEELCIKLFRMELGLLPETEEPAR
jgi:hypothetical protein